MIDNAYPTLRAGIDIKPVMQGGQPHLLLRDPLQLGDDSLIVPQPLGLVLAVCDGTLPDARALSKAVAIRYGVHLAPVVIERLVAALDQAFMLENRAYARARAQALAAFRRAPFRPAASAGHAYPADARELRRQLDNFLSSVAPSGPAPEAMGQASGLVSPHIDYERGGRVYAQVWKAAAESVRQADLAVILGTNHFGDGLLTLTRQNYGTPYGPLPTPTTVVDSLADALGQSVFEGELFHRTEHSVELAAVWLQHMREGQPVDVLPVLCGSLNRHLDGREIEDDPQIQRFTEVLNATTAGRRVMVIAAGDLAHVGPAFGGEPLDQAARTRLRAADAELIARICQGDAAGFWEANQAVEDHYNVCGMTPIYLALRLLGPGQAECTGYALCPADEADTSAVSICGVVIRTRAAGAGAGPSPKG
jgi:AmmeMemoRadiSam system protein B